MRRLLLVWLWVPLTLVAVAVVLGVFATRPGIETSDLPRVRVDASVQDRARAKVADFTQEAETARATGKAQPAQLSFSHDEMTALIGEWGRQGHWFGLVQDLQVTFVPGGMTLTGRLQTAGLEFQFRLDINIKIENRERTAEVVQAQIGQLIVPGFVRGILLGLAMRTLDAGLPRVPMVIESLLVGEGELLISGEVLP